VPKDKVTQNKNNITMLHPRSKKFQLIPFIISLTITLVIGYVASAFTRPEIPTWYQTLHKPSFTPPSWLFPIAWTLIYIMIAIAAYLVWKRRNRTPVYTFTKAIYFVQLLLNFSWSIVFFGMHQILGALVIILLLWVFIIFNMYSFGKFSKAAAWLFLPYLLWVSFASVLNFSIYMLNS
jgi:benzodiazapine receptor